MTDKICGASGEPCITGELYDDGSGKVIRDFGHGVLCSCEETPAAEEQENEA